MLHALVDYAKTNGIIGEAGFTTKNIRWFIIFDSRGEFIGIQTTATGKKADKGRVFDQVPHLKFTGDSPMRQFLVDTAKYALLFGEKSANVKLVKKHNYFLHLLREASAVEPFLGKVASALADENIRKKICDELEQQTPKAKPSDNITFVELHDNGARVIVEETSWHAWWRKYFPTLFAKKNKTEPMLCFLSGEIIQPILTHPKIKGLGDVGGRSETTLICFNKDSFCSYGLSQSRNAAMSSEMAEQYAAGLNHLISNNSRPLAGAKVVYWYVGEVEDEDDPVADLFAGVSPGYFPPLPEDEEDVAKPPTKQERLDAEGNVAKLLNAIRQGRRPQLQKARYCALTLSGNTARVVIRDWMEGSFENLLENINNWFNCLDICNHTGTDHIMIPGIEFLITSLLPERKPNQTYDKWIKQVGSERIAIWKAALNRNLGIPPPVLSRLVMQHRNFIVKGQLAEAIEQKNGSATAILHRRMALMKAYHVRKGDINMSHSLNKQYPHPAYHCGRLMYILANLQKKALPDVKAGIVQRYYAAASSRPALVIGQLITKSKFHLSILGKEQEGFAIWFENTIAEIMDAIQANGVNDIPATLNLEEQSLFALGYYHQMAYRHNAETE